MKTILAALLLLAPAAPAKAADKRGGFLFVSPLPGSSLVSRNTNIIVRDPLPVRGTRADELRGIMIVGSESGRHEARFAISDNGATGTWSPESPFTPGETVTVTIPGPPLRGLPAGERRFSWSFTVSGMTAPATPFSPAESWAGLSAAVQSAGVRGAASRPDSVPSDFPAVTVDSSSNPSPGAMFLTTTDILAGLGFYAMAFDNSGNPVGYRKTSPCSVNDFKVQPNGLLSYARVTGVAGAVGIAPTTEIVLDSTLAVVDSFQCGNGYTADFHEFLLLPNGHAMMMAYDPQVIDMSRIVAGGKPNAVVYGSIIQELDAQKNVVFQWRSWDYIPVTDCYDNITASTFDYIHVNSLEVDNDGNLLVSCRETAEILKIDRVTGEIIWRWGGKHNQFTFIGETSANAPNYFSYQHDVRRIANGHITMMDNGNQHVPPYSRAAEYALDENGKTATLVWEYRHVPDVFDPAAGNVQRLANGNTVVGWGTSNFLGVGNAAVTEVRPNRSVAFELTMPKGLFSYRARRFAWKSELPSATVNLYDLHPGVTYQFALGGETTGVSIMLTSGTAMYSRVTVTRYPFSPLNPLFGPSFGPNAPSLAPVRAVIDQAGFASYSGVVTFDSTFTALMSVPGQMTVYSRATADSGAFSPLATTYDAVARTLSVSTSQFGEFAFGSGPVTGTPTSPALYAPPNGATVNQLSPVPLAWSSRGRALRYRIQVSADSTFKSTNVSDSTASPRYTLNSPMPDTIYYWRAQSVGDSSSSAWSTAWKFATRPPFISMSYPSGGETLDDDSTYIIRWQSNEAGAASITLLNAGGTVMSVSDSTANSGAYLWKLPGTIATGSSYRILVKSRSDTALTTESQGTFTIQAPVTSADMTGTAPHVFALEQNYPNPFNPTTEIRYAIPQRADVTLEVFNMLGQRIATLVDRAQDAGSYSVRFEGTNVASGLYFYRLRAGSNVKTLRLVIVK